VIAHSRNTPYSIHSCVFKPLRTEAVDRKHGISEPSHADVHPIRGGYSLADDLRLADVVPCRFEHALTQRHT